VKNIKDYLDREEVESILTAASTQSERDYLIIRTMWRTGMRVSELVAMTLAKGMRQQRRYIRPKSTLLYSQVKNIPSPTFIKVVLESLHIYA